MRGMLNLCTNLVQIWGLRPLPNMMRTLCCLSSGTGLHARRYRQHSPMYWVAYKNQFLVFHSSEIWNLVQIWGLRLLPNMMYPYRLQSWSQSHPLRNHTKSNFSCVFYVVIWVWKFILKIEHRGFNGADAVNLLMPLILAVPMMYWVANRNQPFVTFVTGSWLDWTFCSVIFWLMKIAWWIHKPIFIILILKISLDWKVNLIYSNQPARNDTFFFKNEKACLYGK